MPEAVRKGHRIFWREMRKWDRRVSRTSDELKISRMRDIRTRIAFRLRRHWDREIKPFFLAPEKPEGLDAFLEELGLDKEPTAC